MTDDSGVDWSMLAPPLPFETEEHIEAFAEQVYCEMRQVELQIDDSADPASNDAYRWIQDAVSGAGNEVALADGLRSMARPGFRRDN